MRWGAVCESVILSLLWIFFAGPSIAARQMGNAPTLLVTPSTAIIGVGGDLRFSAIDGTGHPLSDVQWSIDNPIGELHDENGQIRIDASQTGRAVVTATANNQTASATISVLPATELRSGVVNWSLNPMPGYETLHVSQAVPTADAPTLYSIEWSRTSNAIVRALNGSGQQLWARLLASRASPSTLDQTLPAPGEVYQNEVLTSDHSEFIIGEANGFMNHHSTDPSSYGLPPDGKTILVRAVSDFSGRLILLERGRFHDSLVSLSAADGSEVWRYSSEGRLTPNLTANYDDDIGIVETIAHPPSSGLLILNDGTGQVRFRIPFSISSSTIDGFRCSDPQHNILKSIRPSRSGSVFTSSDANIYVQVETHVESTRLVSCESKEYSFDDSLALLRVTPGGETEWKVFEHIHADGDGHFVPQARLFPGETIPAGPEGVLAAWTYLSPLLDNGKTAHIEARLSRIFPSSQQDFTLPLIFWTKGIDRPFSENMVLGEGNILYATNGALLVRFDSQAGGVVDWGRHPPTGEIKLQFSTEGGGVLVSNAGRLVLFSPDGNGQPLPWTVASDKLDDIGLAQTDPSDGTPLTPIMLRELQLTWYGNFVAVEDGAPVGHGNLLGLYH